MPHEALQPPAQGQYHCLTGSNWVRSPSIFLSAPMEKNMTQKLTVFNSTICTCFLKHAYNKKSKRLHYSKLISNGL